MPPTRAFDSDGSAPPSGRSSRRGYAVLLTVLALLGAACGGDDADSTTPGASVTTADGEFSDYIGLTEEAAGEQAEAAGLPWRVIERDGEPLPATADLIEERLNFVVEDGLVVEVTTG